MASVGPATASVNRPFDPGTATAARIGSSFDQRPLRPDDAKPTLTPVEQGATLVFDKKTGTVGVQNVGGLGSTSGSFSPDTTLKDPKKDGLLGIFHTHPYDKSEGGHTGVSLSGGDAAYMINGKQNIIVAQGGTQQFLFMRTAKTPTSVDFAKVDAANNKRISDLTANGVGFAAASRTAARETAVKYNLAYYEGTDGVLNRVSPK